MQQGSVISVKLPSGLEVDIRRFKTPEIDLMANPNTARDPKTFDRLLEAVVIETGDLPPFYNTMNRFSSSKLLVGDRMGLLYFLRRWTFGDELAFDWNCQVRGCGALNKHETDLVDMIVKPLPEESYQILSDGHNFKATLPDSGIPVEFKLLRGEDELKLSKLSKQRPDERMTMMINYRLTLLDGQPPSPRRIIDLLEGFDISWLQQEFERVDCGVQTGTQVGCQECGAVQELDIPFTGRGFWMAPKNLRRTLTNTVNQTLAVEAD